MVQFFWDYRLIAERGQNSIVVDVNGLSQAERDKLDAAIDKAGFLGQVQARITGTVERQALATFQLAATQLVLSETGDGDGKTPGLGSDPDFDEAAALVDPGIPGEPFGQSNSNRIETRSGDRGSRDGRYGNGGNGGGGNGGGGNGGGGNGGGGGSGGSGGSGGK